MSYRIEITADTLSELAGKAMTLAAKLNTDVATEAGVAAPVAADPVTPEPAAEPEAPAAPAIDFNEEVTPLVLKLVEVRGKPVAQEVLSRFGVTKASQLGSEHWQELIDVINAELGL